MCKEDPALAPNAVLTPNQTYFVFLNRKSGADGKDSKDEPKDGAAPAQEEGPLVKRSRGRPQPKFEWLVEGIPLKTADELLQAQKLRHSYETQMSTAWKAGDVQRLAELTNMYNSISVKIQQGVANLGEGLANHHESDGVRHTKKAMAALNTVAGLIIKREKESQLVVSALASNAPLPIQGSHTTSSSLALQAGQSTMVAMSPEVLEEYKLFLAFRSAQKSKDEAEG
jgi:hypothetical protein